MIAQTLQTTTFVANDNIECTKYRRNIITKYNYQLRPVTFF